MLRRLVVLLLLCSAALATRMWTAEEFERFYATYRPHTLPRPDSLIYGPRRFNYLERIRLTCEFIRQYQVTDSLSADFGGIIEAEHMPGVIETDNTQEAIWVWSRWRELTGRDDYRTQIRRAWTYVRRHPAYREHGGQPANLWYAIWNCGLGFMAEEQYRRTYGDTTFRPYADTCRSFYLSNAMPQLTNQDYDVIAQSAGMAYDYAVREGDALLRDSALARGTRVKARIESGAQAFLAHRSWAMCGGTALWGVAHTYCRADTAAGRLWLLRYADSLPGFYPAGTWNNSHNIWLANAYRSAAELTGAGPCWLMHHYLVDTLLMRDTDKDGGIPATWTDPSTQDQTWVSTYLDFMGMDVFVWPPRTHDLAALEFVSPSDREFYLAGDSIEVRVPLANCGLGDETDVRLKVRGPGYADSTLVGLLGFCESETLEFTRFVAAAPGEYELDAITGATADSNPLNDTSHVRFRVYGLWTLSGTVLDSATSDPLHAWVKARIGAGPQVWDSCETNRSGQFALEVIDSLIRLDVEPFAPYYRRSWLVPVHGDTNVTLLLQPAHVALVNCDSAGRYAGYYTSTFDTLGLTCFEWYRPDSNLPWFVLDRLRLRTIVWYSGDAVTGTVPAQDRDSLAAFVGRSGNLLLTGQNVAEELAGTAFLENTVGCRFDSSGVTSFVVFGNRQDSLGRLMPGTSTAGAGGAGNQTSRDAVTPLAGASSFAVYDTTSNICAGTRRQAAGGGRVVFLGFGFEAVNRPSSRPTYFTRVQLMDLVLSWFAGSTAIAEQPPAAARHSPSATIVRGVLHLPRDMTEFGSANSGRVPRLMDVTGRKVADLRPGPNDVRHLPPGLYFLRMASSEGRTANTKVLIVE